MTLHNSLAYICSPNRGAESTASRSGCSLRAVKITVASKIACFRYSIIGSPRSLGLKSGRQERGFYTHSANAL
jgi:hypothetical protein